MSTLSPAPALDAPRQLTVHLPWEFGPIVWNSSIDFASSTTHVALGFENCVCIYSLPAFDLVDTIKPGKLAGNVEPLKIYERILGVICEFDDSGDVGPGLFLYVWDLSARKLIGTVMCNPNNHQTFFSVCFPSAEIPEIGQRSSKCLERPKDALLAVCSRNKGKAAYLETYALSHRNAEPVEGDNERSQGCLLLTPATTICSIHLVHSLASMGKTALTGGWDGTVRTWDVVTGNCELVLISHTGSVSLVHLDDEKIYASSDDHTIRAWNRYNGDCLHLLAMPRPTRVRNIFVTLPYLIATTTGTTVSVWEIIPGKLEQRIYDLGRCESGPIQGKEPTLAAMKVNEDSSIYQFRICDLRSGRLLTSLEFEPGSLEEEKFLQGRFFLSIATHDDGYVLKVGDFGANDSLDAEVDSDDRRSSRDDVTDKTEGKREDDHGKAMDSSPSSSIVEDTLTSGSKVSGERNTGKTKSFIRRLFWR